MKKIIAHMKVKYPELEEIELMTDGCAGQFKNKFFLSNLMHAVEEFGVKLTANYYPSHHGKSLCDSIGGTIKRNVRARVLTGEFTVYNAKDFVECANSFVKKIVVWEVKQTEVVTERKKVEARWAEVKTVTGTRSFHYFKPSVEKIGYLRCAVTSLGHGSVYRKI
jgi:hypothetical protein